MGNHRAERRDLYSGPSETQADSSYAGRRAARPEPADTTAAPTTAAPTIAALTTAQVRSAQVTSVAVTSPGKRKAVKHAGSRGSLFRGLPSPPVLLGVATLAVAVGGVLTSAGGTSSAPELTGTVVNEVRPATALSASGAVGTVDTMRARLSRSGPREALEQASENDLVEVAEQQAEQRNAALGALAAQAELQAAKIKENRWFLPLTPVVITATYGEYGLWSSYHTGTDFNGNSGDPIYSVANGVVTFVGYDGAYGNKTVVTLEDGTELWYAHQTAQYVSVGDSVVGNEVIGTVGATGNVTGSHLHLEVRPGGGDPVDPYAAFVAHGITP